MVVTGLRMGAVRCLTIVLMFVLAMSLGAGAQTEIDAASGGRLFIGATYVDPPYTVSVEGRIVLVNDFVVAEFDELPEPFDPGTASFVERQSHWAATAGWIYAGLIDSGVANDAAMDSVEVFLTTVARLHVTSKSVGSFGIGIGTDTDFDSLYDPSRHTPEHYASDRKRRADAPRNRARAIAETLGFRTVNFLNFGYDVGIWACTSEERDLLTEEAIAFLAGDLPDWEHAETLEYFMDSYEKRPMQLRTLDETRNGDS